MEVETLTILKLDSKESAALKKLLGAHSHNSKTQLGLTCDESEITSRIYDVLPLPEEENA